MVGPAIIDKLAALMAEYGENETHIAALEGELLKITPKVQERLEPPAEPRIIPMLTKENKK